MKNIVIALLVILLLSCNQQKKEVDFITQNDLKNKFSVQIPESWEVIKDTVNFESDVFFFDKSKSKSQRLTYGIILNTTDVFLNQDFDKLSDSIMSIAKLDKLSGDFGEVNNFKTYKVNFLDKHTVTQLGNYETHYYMKKENVNGYLLFSIQRAELGLEKSDSVLSERIIRSIKLKSINSGRGN